MLQYTRAVKYIPGTRIPAVSFKLSDSLRSFSEPAELVPDLGLETVCRNWKELREPPSYEYKANTMAYHMR
jgi:hypothetical protein